MTPFWNQTSPSNLYPASLGILDGALSVVAPDDELHWNIGLQARMEILLNGKSIEQPTPQLLAVREKLKLGDHDMMFCGLRAVVNDRDFPRNRLELISTSRGHIGTVEIVE